MSSLSDVVLRYQAPGHLRFDLPDRLCGAETASALVSRLRAEAGIYRVDLKPGARKLSLRYLDWCTFADIIRRLAAVISGFPRRVQTEAPAHAVVMSGAGRAVTPAPALPGGLQHWLRVKWLEIRETLMAINILVRRALGSGANSLARRPKWIKEFLNDLLMLYLIKLHWHHILTEWLPRPWTHRYEWAATIYLIHLSVQSKLPQNG